MKNRPERLQGQASESSGVPVPLVQPMGLSCLKLQGDKDTEAVTSVKESDFIGKKRKENHLRQLIRNRLMEGETLIPNHKEVTQKEFTF